SDGESGGTSRNPRSFGVSPPGPRAHGACRARFPRPSRRSATRNRRSHPAAGDLPQIRVVTIIEAYSRRRLATRTVRDAVFIAHGMNLSVPLVQLPHLI